MVGSYKKSLDLRIQAKLLRVQGLTNEQIAAQLGVTKQHVSYMMNNTRRRRESTVLAAQERRATGKREYRCGVCGERGHNAQRHRNYGPEDIEYMKRHDAD